MTKITFYTLWLLIYSYLFILFLFRFMKFSILYCFHCTCCIRFVPQTKHVIIKPQASKQKGHPRSPRVAKPHGKRSIQIYFIHSLELCQEVPSKEPLFIITNPTTISTQHYNLYSICLNKQKRSKRRCNWTLQLNVE